MDADLPLSIWDRLEQSMEREEVIEGKVISETKGGLYVDIGVRAFMPGSEVDVRRVPDFSAYVGVTVKARVLRVEPHRANVVLSRRRVLEDEKRRAATRLKELQPGQVVDATVLRTRHDGAVEVDLSDLSAVVPPSEVPADAAYRPAQDVRVTICDVREGKVVVSLRLPEDETARRGSAGGRLVVDVSDAANIATARDHIERRAVEATGLGIAELLVRARPEQKRELRDVVKRGDIPHIDYRRSRQTPQGLVLLLVVPGSGYPD